jgi:Na+-transporting NADH:ubiquinone oxidoreductase subunit NqrB
MSISENEPREQLELIAAANRRMVEQAKAPGWYHWVLGVLMGGLCAADELPMPWPAAYIPVALGGLVWLIRAYRRRTGMWIPGYRAGRTRWVAFSSAALVGLIFLAAIVISRRTGLHGVYLAGGVLIALAAVLRGHAWEKAYRRDLGVD